MEEQTREIPAADSWREEFAQSLDERRRQARELLKAERDRLRELESRFTARIVDLADRIAAEENAAQGRSSEQECRAAALAEQDQKLSERLQWLRDQEQVFQDSQRGAQQQQEQLLSAVNEKLAQLDARQAEREAADRQLEARQIADTERERDLARQSTEAKQRAAELEKQLRATKERQAALEASQQAHQIEVEELKTQLFEYRQLQEQLANRDQETQKQRRHIAHQLRARKKELIAETELHRAEALASAAGQELQLQMRLSELQGKYERLRDELANRDQQRDQFAQQAASLTEQLQARQAELLQQQQASQAVQAERARIAAERDNLARELAEARDRTQHDLEAIRQASTTEAGKLQAELTLKLGEARQQAEEAQAELAKVRQQTDAQLAAARAEQDQLHQAQIAGLQAEVQRLTGERDARAEGTASFQSQWNEQKNKLEAELAALRAQPQGSGAAATALARLREENALLEACLAEAEEKAKNAGTSPGDQDDLRRRFEMAVADVRELKTKNAELSDQLTRAKKAGGAPAASSSGASAGGSMDWEAQKKRLLEQLEGDFDQSDSKQAQDKLTVEGAIRITDQVLSDKEKEIVELRQLLHHQSDNIGGVAVGAAAIAGMLDSDELIKQERESLRQMQESLREQLRKAEVDISVERAKLARERAELDEKMQSLTADIARHSAPGEALSMKAQDKKPARGRWLARLGLKEGEEA